MLHSKASKVAMLAAVSLLGPGRPVLRTRPRGNGCSIIPAQKKRSSLQPTAFLTSRPTARREVESPAPGPTLSLAAQAKRLAAMLPWEKP